MLNFNMQNIVIERANMHFT